MKSPENLKLGDTIGICAPSCGIVDQDKQIKLDKAIKQLTELGYKVIETESVELSLKEEVLLLKKGQKNLLSFIKILK